MNKDPNLRCWGDLNLNGYFLCVFHATVFDEMIILVYITTQQQTKKTKNKKTFQEYETNFTEKNRKIVKLFQVEGH